MPRIALVVPSSTYRVDGFLDAARRAGVDVVVASNHRPVLSDASGDRHVEIDLDHPQKAATRIADHGARVALDAVLGIDDRGVQIAALAAARLGLSHSPVAAVDATRDKARARAALEGAPGVDQPPYRLARPGDDVAALATQVGLPVVVKPVSLSASRGVIRADDPDAAAAAAARTRQILADAGEAPNAPLLVEGYVPGDEVALEGLVTEGSLEVLALFDKPDPLEGPYFEETLYVTPSRHPRARQDAIGAAAQAAVDALGLVHGPVHAEFRLDGDRVVVLELAARTIGGLCGQSLRFGLDMSLEEVIVRHATGLPLRALAREGGASGVMMLPIPRAGVLVDVGGVNEARAVPGIEEVTITIPSGGVVRPLPEGDRYLGFAFARASTPEQVEDALRRAHAALDVRIDEHGPARVDATCASD